MKVNTNLKTGLLQEKHLRSSCRKLGSVLFWVVIAALPSRAQNQAWNAWNDLGGINSNPAVGQTREGLLEVFVKGFDNAGSLYHRWEFQANGGLAWSQWESLAGGNVWSSIAVGRNTDGHLEVFVRRLEDSALWHTWQQFNADGTVTWSIWQSLRGYFPADGSSNPTVARNADGRLEVFIKGMGSYQGHLYHIWQVGCCDWSAWEDLGGAIFSDIAVGRNTDGRLEVFVTSNGALWHKFQLAPGGPLWSDWYSLNAPPQLSFGVGTIPAVYSDAAVPQNVDGPLDVFVKAVDGALWHIRQVGCCGWSGWESLGGQLSSQPTVGKNADGRLEVFATAAWDLYHIRQVAAGGAWSTWESLGKGPVDGFDGDAKPAVGQYADGTLEVFVRGPDTHLWSISQVPELQVMLDWARGDTRFGSIINGSFGKNPNWDSSWELSWVDFNFSGGRRVRLFLATNKANRSNRWVGFYDPDNGSNWTGWLRAYR
jgi:hypothetical protein